ncbi:MAG: hypothetical protein ACTSPM_12810 [Candidatus Heimdallarchaeota archaeon]
MAPISINFDSWEWWLIIVISVLVLTLTLYLSMRFVTGRKKLTVGYFFRIFLISIVLLIGLVAVAEAIAQVLTLGYQFAPMFYILMTIGFILIIRYFLTNSTVIPYHDGSSDKYWQWAMWITLISILLLFLIAFLLELISGLFMDPPLTLITF